MDWQVSYDALRDGGRLPEPIAEGDQPADVIDPRELAAPDAGGDRRPPDRATPSGRAVLHRGLTQAEAADELGTRPGAIKTRLHNPRDSLRTSLRTAYEEYIDMTEQTPTLIPMRVTELRRTARAESGVERHIVFLEDRRDGGCRSGSVKQKRPQWRSSLNESSYLDRASTNSLGRCSPAQEPNCGRCA
jgi:hypothetical protein